jgi:excisionase family DNA binding protein
VIRVIYLTPAEVAEMLKVSVKTVSRWALEDPSMPVTRLGRTVRFEAEALERWLRAHGRRRQTQGGLRRAASGCQHCRGHLMSDQAPCPPLAAQGESPARSWQVGTRYTPKRAAALDRRDQVRNDQADRNLLNAVNQVTPPGALSMTTPITPKEIATASIDDAAQSGAGGSSSADATEALNIQGDSSLVSRDSNAPENDTYKEHGRRGMTGSDGAPV